MIRWLLFFVFSTSSFAKEPVRVTNLSIEAARYYNYRNPYFLLENDRHQKFLGRTNLRLDIGLLPRDDPTEHILYWHNNIHGSVDQESKEYREVGWEFEMGSRINRYFDVFYYHHSEHVLEQERSYKFPLEDSYGIRINLIR